MTLGFLLRLTETSVPVVISAVRKFIRDHPLLITAVAVALDYTVFAVVEM